MPFKAPLTHADLRFIRERRPWNPDVISLLWEVKRPRSVPLRAYQLSSDFKRPAGITGELSDDFMKDLHGEPRVQERDDIKDALMEPSNRLRKGMGSRQRWSIGVGLEYRQYASFALRRRRPCPTSHKLK